MKNIFKQSIYLLFILFYCCTSKISIKEQYNENLQFNDTIICTSKILNDSCIFIMPRQMEIFDTIIIILDEFRPDNFFHIYNTQGKLLKSFGNKGRGPGELLTVSNFHPNKHNNTIAVYNFRKRHIIEYDIQKILHNVSPFYSEHPIEASTTYPQEIIKLDSNNYLCCHRLPQLRYSIQEGNEEKFQYINYPQIEERNIPTFTAAILNYAGQYRLSPDHTKFLEVSYIGAIMDLFKIEKNKMIPIKTRLIYYPYYKVIDDQNAQITWDDATKIGFECIYTSNSYIYSLLNGIIGHELKNPNIQEPYTKNISIFDWEGNPKTLIQTDHMMNALCLDETEQTIYAVAYNKGEHALVKIPLKK